MRFLMRAFSSDPDYDAGCQHVLVDIDSEFAETLQRRFRLFVETKSRDGSDLLLELIYSDCSATFLSSAAVPHSLSEVLEVDDYFPMPEDFDPDCGVRTTCDELHLSEQGLTWTAFLKHSDVQISSNMLSWECIEQVFTTVTSIPPPALPASLQQQEPS